MPRIELTNRFVTSRIFAAKTPGLEETIGSLADVSQEACPRADTTNSGKGSIEVASVYLNSVILARRWTDYRAKESCRNYLQGCTFVSTVPAAKGRFLFSPLGPSACEVSA
jgi:hypothetical protein